MTCCWRHLLYLDLQLQVAGRHDSDFDRISCTRSEILLYVGLPRARHHAIVIRDLLIVANYIAPNLSDLESLFGLPLSHRASDVTRSDQPKLGSNQSCFIKLLFKRLNCFVISSLRHFIPIEMGDYYHQHT